MLAHEEHVVTDAQVAVAPGENPIGQRLIIHPARPRAGRAGRDDHPVVRVHDGPLALGADGHFNRAGAAPETMEARERRERGVTDGDVHRDRRGDGARACRVGDARTHDAAADGVVVVRDDEVGGRRGVVITVTIKIPFDLQKVRAELGIKRGRGVEHDVLPDSRDDGQRGDERLRRAVDRGERIDRRLRRVAQALAVEDGQAVAVGALGIEIRNRETCLRARAGEREFIGHHEALVRLPR